MRGWDGMGWGLIRLSFLNLLQICFFLFFVKRERRRGGEGGTTNDDGFYPPHA